MGQKNRNILRKPQKRESRGGRYGRIGLKKKIDGWAGNTPENRTFKGNRPPKILEGKQSACNRVLQCLKILRAL